MHWTRFWRPGALALGLAFALGLLAGCGGADGDRIPVQGTVTFDGQPVDGGSIAFLPENSDAKAVKVGGPIENGKYELKGAKAPAPGKHRVEIFWHKKTGKQIVSPNDPPNKVDETKQVIPAQYNTKTTLTANVEPGHTTFDFDLKKK